MSPNQEKILNSATVDYTIINSGCKNKHREEGAVQLGILQNTKYTIKLFLMVNFHLNSLFC